jgi:hypothetical protein
MKSLLFSDSISKRQGDLTPIFTIGIVRLTLGANLCESGVPLYEEASQVAACDVFFRLLLLTASRVQSPCVRSAAYTGAFLWV